MEGLSRRRLCIVCCGEEFVEGGGGKLESILELTDYAVGSDLEEMLKKGEGRLAVCGECLEGVGQVVGCRREVKVVENEVMAMQMELVGKLRKLKGKVEVYQRGMALLGKRMEGRGKEEKLGEVLQQVEEMSEEDDTGCRRRRTRGKKRKDNGVILFRREVFKVARELEGFTRNLESKFGIGVDGVEGIGDTTGSSAIEEEVVLVKLEVDPEELEDDQASYSVYQDNLIDNPQEDSISVELEDGGIKEENDSDYVPASDNPECSNSKQQLSKPNAKRRRNKKAEKLKKIQTELLFKSLGIPIDHLPKFRQYLLRRIVRFQHFPPSVRSDPSSSSEFLHVRYQLLQKHPWTYDHSSSQLFIASIPISICDATQTLSCSVCPYSTHPMGASTNSKCYYDMDWRLWSHVVIQHVEPLLCPRDNCSKQLLQLKSLQTHLKDHQVGNLECDICGRPVDTRSSMEGHRWTHLNAQEKAELTRQGKQPAKLASAAGTTYQCDTCGKKFCNKPALRMHQLLHMPKEVQNAAKFVCPDCGISIRNRSYLSQHQKYACAGNDKKVGGVACEVCGAVLRSSVHKRRHVQSLHGPNKDNKLFNCEVCGKALKNKQSLRVHRRGHEGREELFKCGKGCGLAFNRKSNCRRHEMEICKM